MRDINLTFGLGNRYPGIPREYKFLKILFIWFTVLSTNHSLGQENNGIGAYIENNRVILEIHEKIFDSPILFVRHPGRQIQVEWSRVGNRLIMAQKRIESSDGPLMALDDDITLNERIIGQFPILQNRSNGNYFAIDATELFLGAEIKWFKFFTQETVLTNLSYFKNIE